MKSIFIIVLFFLDLPRNALVCKKFGGYLDFALKYAIVANQSKVVHVVTTC